MIPATFWLVTSLVAAGGVCVLAFYKYKYPRKCDVFCYSTPVPTSPALPDEHLVAPEATNGQRVHEATDGLRARHANISWVTASEPIICDADAQGLTTPVANTVGKTPGQHPENSVVGADAHSLTAVVATAVAAPVKDSAVTKTTHAPVDAAVLALEAYVAMIEAGRASGVPRHIESY